MKLLEAHLGKVLSERVLVLDSDLLQRDDIRLSDAGECLQDRGVSVRYVPGHNLCGRQPH